ncbi:unnamed protein product [Amoebophrya sp. A120]|nr:unnamed protein product [Amoebophrya sp. A120]|eukprot:GSA120T00003181001.1
MCRFVITTRAVAVLAVARTAAGVHEEEKKKTEYHRPKKFMQRVDDAERDAFEGIWTFSNNLFSALSTSGSGSSPPEAVKDKRALDSSAPVSHVDHDDDKRTNSGGRSTNSEKRDDADKQSPLFLKEDVDLSEHSAAGSSSSSVDVDDSTRSSWLQHQHENEKVPAKKNAATEEERKMNSTHDRTSEENGKQQHENDRIRNQVESPESASQRWSSSSEETENSSNHTGPPAWDQQLLPHRAAPDIILVRPGSHQNESSSTFVQRQEDETQTKLQATPRTADRMENANGHGGQLLVQGVESEVHSTSSAKLLLAPGSSEDTTINNKNDKKQFSEQNADGQLWAANKARVDQGDPDLHASSLVEEHAINMWPWGAPDSEDSDEDDDDDDEDGHDDDSSEYGHGEQTNEDSSPSASDEEDSEDHGQKMSRKKASESLMTMLQESAQAAASLGLISKSKKVMMAGPGFVKFVGYDLIMARAFGLNRYGSNERVLAGECAQGNAVEKLTGVAMLFPGMADDDANFQLGTWMEHLVNGGEYDPTKEAPKLHFVEHSLNAIKRHDSDLQTRPGAPAVAEGYFYYVEQQWIQVVAKPIEKTRREVLDDYFFSPNGIPQKIKIRAPDKTEELELILKKQTYRKRVGHTVNNIKAVAGFVERTFFPILPNGASLLHIVEDQEPQGTGAALRGERQKFQPTTDASTCMAKVESLGSERDSPTQQSDSVRKLLLDFVVDRLVIGLDDDEDVVRSSHLVMVDGVREYFFGPLARVREGILARSTHHDNTVENDIAQVRNYLEEHTGIEDFWRFTKENKHLHLIDPRFDSIDIGELNGLLDKAVLELQAEKGILLAARNKNQNGLISSTTPQVLELEVKDFAALIVHPIPIFQEAVALKPRLERKILLEKRWREDGWEELEKARKILEKKNKRLEKKLEEQNKRHLLANKHEQDSENDDEHDEEEDVEDSPEYLKARKEYVEAVNELRQAEKEARHEYFLREQHMSPLRYALLTDFRKKTRARTISFLQEDARLPIVTDVCGLAVREVDPTDEAAGPHKEGEQAEDEDDAAAAGANTNPEDGEQSTSTSDRNDKNPKKAMKMSPTLRRFLQHFALVHDYASNPRASPCYFENIPDQKQLEGCRKALDDKLVYDVTQHFDTNRDATFQPVLRKRKGEEQQLWASGAHLPPRASRYVKMMVRGLPLADDSGQRYDAVAWHHFLTVTFLKPDVERGSLTGKETVQHWNFNQRTGVGMNDMWGDYFGEEAERAEDEKTREHLEGWHPYEFGDELIEAAKPGSGSLIVPMTQGEWYALMFALMLTPFGDGKMYQCFPFTGHQHINCQSFAHLLPELLRVPVVPAKSSWLSGSGAAPHPVDYRSSGLRLFSEWYEEQTKQKKFVGAIKTVSEVVVQLMMKIPTYGKNISKRIRGFMTEQLGPLLHSAHERVMEYMSASALEAAKKTWSERLSMLLLAIRTTVTTVAAAVASMTNAAVEHLRRLPFASTAQITNDLSGWARRVVRDAKAAAVTLTAGSADAGSGSTDRHQGIPDSYVSVGLEKMLREEVNSDIQPGDPHEEEDNLPGALRSDREEQNPMQREHHFANPDPYGFSTAAPYDPHGAESQQNSGHGSGDIFGGAVTPKQESTNAREHAHPPIYDENKYGTSGRENEMKASTSTHWNTIRKEVARGGGSRLQDNIARELWAGLVAEKDQQQHEDTNREISASQQGLKEHPVVAPVAPEHQAQPDAEARGRPPPAGVGPARASSVPSLPHQHLHQTPRGRSPRGRAVSQGSRLGVGHEQRLESGMRSRPARDRAPSPTTRGSRRAEQRPPGSSTSSKSLQGVGAPSSLGDENHPRGERQAESRAGDRARASSPPAGTPRPRAGERSGEGPIFTSAPSRQAARERDELGGGRSAGPTSTSAHAGHPLVHGGRLGGRPGASHRASSVPPRGASVPSAAGRTKPTVSSERSQSSPVESAAMPKTAAPKAPAQGAAQRATSPMKADIDGGAPRPAPSGREERSSVGGFHDPGGRSGSSGQPQPKGPSNISGPVASERGRSARPNPLPQGSPYAAAAPREGSPDASSPARVVQSQPRSRSQSRSPSPARAAAAGPATSQKAPAVPAVAAGLPRTAMKTTSPPQSSRAGPKTPSTSAASIATAAASPASASPATAKALPGPKRATSAGRAAPTAPAPRAASASPVGRGPPRPEARPPATARAASAAPPVKANAPPAGAPVLTAARRAASAAPPVKVVKAHPAGAPGPAAARGRPGSATPPLVAKAKAQAAKAPPAATRGASAAPRPASKTTPPTAAPKSAAPQRGPGADRPRTPPPQQGKPQSQSSPIKRTMAPPGPATAAPPSQAPSQKQFSGPSGNAARAAASVSAHDSSRQRTGTSSGVSPAPARARPPAAAAPPPVRHVAAAPPRGGSVAGRSSSQGPAEPRPPAQKSQQGRSNVPATAARGRRYRQGGGSASSFTEKSSPGLTREDEDVVAGATQRQT